jgi:hypothetical protein
METDRACGLQAEYGHELERSWGATMRFASKGEDREDELTSLVIS